jgi:hypothetical protein
MTTTTERKTCEQLVDDRLKDRLEDIRKSAGLDPQGKPTFEPLSIDRVTTYKVCLSFVGACGPADFLELDWDGEGWIGGRYIYQDWFDDATRTITDEEVEELAETFGIYPNLARGHWK